MINNIGQILNKHIKQNIHSVYDEINATEYYVVTIKELKAILKYYMEYEDFKELLVIKKVQDFLKGENIKNKVYFNLSWDKYNNLIALYFNIDSFLEKGTEHVLLFTNSKRTFLQMTLWNIDSQFTKTYRNNVAHVYIDDFRSYYPRMGHGYFILKNLDFIINEINKVILLNHDNLFPIKSVAGTVIPLNQIITYDNLVKIYMDNGFSIIKQKKSNGIERTVIIKSFFTQL